MDGLGGHYATSDGEKQILYDFNYMQNWNLKSKEMNTLNKQSHRHKEQKVVARGERGERMRDTGEED